MRSDYKLPPGPQGIPLLGSLSSFRKNPTDFLQRLAHQYGDIAQFRLGKHRAFQLNHPDFIRNVLITHNRKFHKGRGLERAKRVMGEGLITSEGDFHHRQRRLAQPAFHKSRLDTYGLSMIDHALQLEERWRDGARVDMYSEMLRLTLSIVGKTLFNANIESEARDIGRAMATVFEYFNRLMLPYASLMDKLPISTPSRHRFDQAKAFLDQTVYRLISERRQTGDDKGDLLSIFLLSRDTEGDGTSMTDCQARDEVMTMFLAGHETTGAALTWTWFLLSQNPDAQAELHSELRYVLGGRTPTIEDISKLEYTRMVFAESLRLYPPVWTLTRRALEDYEIGGYVIPAGSTVGLCQYVMHRDPRYYNKPEQFDPLRWTAEEIAQRPKYSYFPFGGGPRLCIGESFAWMEGILMLATLCQNWQAEVVHSHRVHHQPLITLRPKGGLPMILRRRNLNSRKVPSAKEPASQCQQP